MHSPTGCCCTTDRIVWMQSFKYREKSRSAAALFFLYKEKPLARRVVQKKAFADHEDKKNSLC